MDRVNSLGSVLSHAIGDALKHRVERDHGLFALSPAYCRQVARWYDAAPMDGAGRRGRALYECFKLETDEQYEALRSAGLIVRPWLGEGQPYANSHELRHRVRSEGTLYVYLTANGHGPEGADPHRLEHPMLEPSPHTIDGITLTYNDLFRAVHDLFGHVMHPNTFRIEGELRAVKSHLTMYSAELAPVVLAESAAQICWFYFGPHLDRAADTAATGAGAGAGAQERPYPPQKVLVMPARLVRGFWKMFARPAGRPARSRALAEVAFA
jgi:hypothetical protein